MTYIIHNTYCAYNKRNFHPFTPARSLCYSISMNINKILRGLLLTGVFAIALCPLIVSGSLFFPFITGKNYFFRIIVEVMLGLWLVLMYRDRGHRPKRSGILIALTAYVGIQALATIFGENPTRSFWSNFERMEGLVSYLHSYLFFIIAISIMRTKEIWRWFLNATVAVSAIVSIYGIGQMTGALQIHQGSTRLDATLGNAAYLASYLLFHIFILFYLFTSTPAKNKGLRYTYGLLAVLELIILYYTATRGAILGLIGGIMVALFLLGLKHSGHARKVSFSVLGAILLFIALFWSLRTTSFIANSPVLGRFASISATETTTQSRFLIWNMSWQGFKEHPLLGWGPENYPLVFQKYYTPQMWRQEPWFDRSHNIVFDNLISFGLIGLLAYISLFGTALYYLWRDKKDGGLEGRVLLTGLLAGYFFHNIFVFDNLVSTIMFLVILGYIHTVYSPLKGEAGIKKNSQDSLMPLVVVGAIILSSLSFYYLTWRGINVSQTLISALSKGTAEERLADFEKIFSYGAVTGQSEAREQILSVAQSVIGEQATSDDLKQKYFTLVKKETERQFAVFPDDARSRLFYGSFLANVGQRQAAIAELEKARQLSPKKQAILFELGSLYLNNNQIDLGLEQFKQAFEEDTTYDTARRMYALAALATGRKALADEILGPDPIKYLDDDRFLNYYASIKRYDIVLKIWQERVKNNPKDKQTIVSLAAAYYYAGDRQQAIKTIEDLAKIDPSFAAEAESLVGQIRTGQIK